MKNIELYGLIEKFNCLKGLRINGALTGHLLTQRKSLEDSFKIYQEARNEIILNHCEKDKDGTPILITKNQPQFKDEETKLECSEAIAELDSAEFELVKTSALGQNYLLSLNEISLEQFELLKLFINE